MSRTGSTGYQRTGGNWMPWERGGNLDLGPCPTSATFGLLERMAAQKKGREVEPSSRGASTKHEHVHVDVDRRCWPKLVPAIGVKGLKDIRCMIQIRNHLHPQAATGPFQFSSAHHPKPHKPATQKDTKKPRILPKEPFFLQPLPRGTTGRF